jgi:peptidoglycan/LPS O-acetylase OafA/YrhL
MWHLPLLFLYMNAILPQIRDWGRYMAYMGIVAWILFIIFPVTLALYRWVEMPGVRLGEALLRWIETLKKQRSANLAEVVPVQDKAAARESLPLPVE